MRRAAWTHRPLRPLLSLPLPRGRGGSREEQASSVAAARPLEAGAMVRRAGDGAQGWGSRSGKGRGGTVRRRAPEAAVVEAAGAAERVREAEKNEGDDAARRSGMRRTSGGQARPCPTCAAALAHSAAAARKSRAMPRPRARASPRLKVPSAWPCARRQGVWRRGVCKGRVCGRRGECPSERVSASLRGRDCAQRPLAALRA